MQRTAKIHLQFSEEIDEALERFGDHEGMSLTRLLRWLDQFDDDDLGLAVETINAVQYYDSANIRSMTKLLFRIVSDELAERNLNTALFVAVGSGGSGSSTVVRVLRDLIRNTPHKVATMLDVAQLQPGTVDAVVFLDDFSGTGDTLVAWWENVESIVRPSNSVVFVGLLIVNEPARARIAQFAEVLSVTELDEAANVLAPESTTFSDEQKGALLRCCRETNCGPRYERGYGGCGLLVVLKHGCPNNTLPILWYNAHGWRRLFNRRGI
jgi:hypothetical protein